MSSVVEQCAMRMRPGCGCCEHTLLCIRDAGHEGPHKNYTGRWDSASEFRSSDTPYMMPAPVLRAGDSKGGSDG